MTAAAKPCIIAIMLINVTKVKSTTQSSMGLSLAEELDTAACGCPELRLVGPVSFRGVMENAAPYLELNGRVKGKIRLECARCLAPFEQELEALVAEAYTNKPEALDPEDADAVSFFEGDFIDIGPALVKALFLELPMHPLCRPDCRGICPQCGANLNTEPCSCSNDAIDIRMAGLQSLLEAMTNHDK